MYCIGIVEGHDRSVTSSHPDR